MATYGTKYSRMYHVKFVEDRKVLMGSLFEYLPGWPEPTEEEVIRLCLCDAIFINF